MKRFGKNSLTISLFVPSLITLFYPQLSYATARSGANANVFVNPLAIGDGNSAVSSSILDVKSTSKGVLWPRMTSTQRAAILSPANGLLVWDSTLKEPCQYDSGASAWECFPPGSTSSLGTLKVVETDSNGLLTGASSLGISLGGTGQATANAALNALLPSQTGNANKVLQTDGSNTSWATASGGGGGLNFVGLNTSFVLGTSDDVGAENSTGNWATYADAAGTDPVDMTGGSATALTFSRTTTSGEVLDGSGSFKIVKAASNAQGMGVSVLVNEPPGYRGQNQQITIPFHIISGSISSDDLKLEAYDVTSSALLSISCNTGSSTDANQVYTTVTVLVICNGAIPSSTAQIRIGFHFASTSTTAVTFSFDDVYIAPPSNIGQVAQAQLLGTVTISGCADKWATSSTSFGDFSTQTGCSYSVTGQLSAPSTNIPGFKITNGPPGEYLIIYSGFIGQTNTAAAGGGSYFKMYDGTNYSNDEALFVGVSATSIVNNGAQTWHISETGSTAGLIFRVQAKVGNASANAAISGTNDSLYTPGKFSVYVFPSSSQTVMKASQAGGSWTGSLAGTGGGWTTTSGTYADFSVATTSTTLTSLSSVNFGTVTAESTKLPGVTFTPSAVGTFHVCAGGSFWNTGTASSYVQLVDSNGNVLNSGQRNGTAANDVVPFSLCGTDNITSTSPITFKLKGAASSSTATLLQDSLAPITWEIYPVSQSMPAPLLVNSVTSSSAGVERVHRLSLLNNGTCSVGSEDGSWATVTATPVSTGRCTINIASGEFGAAPTCQCTANPASGDGRTCNLVNLSGTSSFDVITDVAGTPTNMNAHIFCMGTH